MLRKIPKLQVPAKAEAKPAATGSKPPNLFADVLNKTLIDHHRSVNFNVANARMHVSDLMQSAKDREFCPRQFYMMLTGGSATNTIRRQTPGQRLLWRMGHTIQDHLTQEFIDRSNWGHTLWGDWKCRCGHTINHHSFLVDSKCAVCQGPVNVYREVDIGVEDLLITGHPDILVVWNETIHIYEVKTIDRAQVLFDDLKEPLGDHTLQATFYYWIMRSMFERGLLPYPISNMLNYIYIDRSGSKVFFGEPYKEFTKAASPADRLAPFINKATQVVAALSENKAPYRICESYNVTRAKNCQDCVKCFSVD